jgi:hypothetical protein
MKHALTHAFALMAGALFWLASNAALADAAGPYYAMPSWDQTLPSSTRFVVLSNMSSQAVLDRETGLVWQRTPYSTTGVDWHGALAFCPFLRLGNRFGWRLPTLQELGSLLDPAATSGPPLPAGHPFTGVPAAAAFWTATAVADASDTAYVVAWALDSYSQQFYVLPAEPQFKAFTSYNVYGYVPLQIWCVRGGLQAAPQ